MRSTHQQRYTGFPTALTYCLLVAAATLATATTITTVAAIAAAAAVVIIATATVCLHVVAGMITLLTAADAH